MNELLTRILAAHGGMNRWNGYEKVDFRFLPARHIGRP